MSALEMLSLAPLVTGVAAILRFVWLDSQRFPEPSADGGRTEGVFVSRVRFERLVRQAEVARMMSEAGTLPKAA